MKRSKLKDRFSHYIPLMGIYGAAIVAFRYFYYEKNFLVGVALGLTVAYVSWGIVHHVIHRELNSEVVFEYLSVSIVGLIVLLTLIMRM